MGLLEGKYVNLRIVEKEDVPLFTEWFNDTEFFGEFGSPSQWSQAEMQRFLESTFFETKVFFIENKKGSKIGYVIYFNVLAPYTKMLELGYAVIPSERGKGCCTEAAKMMVDHLFLSKDVARIQASTHTKNVVSQKILEKIGFKREGTMRKCWLCRGEWADMFIFSILREEWKGPRILTRKT